MLSVEVYVEPLITECKAAQKHDDLWLVTASTKVLNFDYGTNKDRTSIEPAF